MDNSPDPLLETPRFQVVRVHYETARGPQAREIIRHPGAVTIIPFVDDDHVCLIEQWRPSVARKLIELPAGTLEPDEPPAATAARELIEETGYRSQHIEPVHEFLLSPGILDERMYLFAAHDLTPGDTAREPGEQIENLVVRWDDAMQMVKRGEIEDAKTLVGLMMYDRIRNS